MTEINLTEEYKLFLKRMQFKEVPEYMQRAFYVIWRQCLRECHLEVYKQLSHEEWWFFQYMYNQINQFEVNDMCECVENNKTPIGQNALHQSIIDDMNKSFESLRNKNGE